MLTPPFYVISDTHFFHDNIVKFCNRDEQIAKLNGEPMDHNAYMVEAWNRVVRPEDTVLHLGDVVLWRKGGDVKYASTIMPKLNGTKYLILGNHDNPNLDWEAMGFTVIEPFTIPYKGIEVNFQHYPLDPGVLHPGARPRIVNVHGHIHNNGYPIVPGQGGWQYGTTEDSPMQLNVSVEVVDYEPQSIESLLRPYLTT
jgi:calcineurin-like phosphoesterase family protein